MKKWFIAFGLTLIAFLPQIVFAANDTPTSWFHFAPKSTDLSMKYLCSIFGTIEGVIACPFNPDSVFGPLFKVLNIGMLAIAGLVLIFTTVKTITETASDGSAMGQHTSHWVIIRVVIGNSLLVPRSSGFSVINAIVMWMVVQGVGFADMAWDKVLDYLVQGHVIHKTVSSNIVPPQTDIDKSLTLNSAFVATVGDSNAPTSTDILRSLVCTYALDRTLQGFIQNVINNADQTTPQGRDVVAALSGISLSLNPGFDDVAKVVHFPQQPDKYTMDNLKSALSKYGNYDLSKIQNLDGICGVYDWGTPKSISKYSATVSAADYQKVKGQALKAMVSDLTPTAKSIVDNIISGTYVPDANGNYGIAQDTVTDNVYSASQKYFLNVKTMRQNFFNPPPAQGVTPSQLAPENAPIRADGWAGAGKYFWNIVKPPKIASVSMNDVLGDDDFNNYGFGGKDNSPVVFPIDYQQGGTSERISRWNALKGNLSDSLVYRGGGKDAESLANFDSSFIGKRTSQIQNMLSLVNKSSAAAFTKADAEYQRAIGSITGGLPPPGAGTNYLESYGMTIKGLDLGTLGRNLQSEALDKGVQGAAMSASGLAAVAGLPMAVRGWSKYIPGMFFLVVADLIDNWNKIMGDPNLSPMEKVMSVGTEMVQKAQDFWTGLFNLFVKFSMVIGGAVSAISSISLGLTIFGFWGTAAGAMSNMAVISTMINIVWQTIETAFTIFLPATIGVSVPLFVTGLTLSVYVPLIPFMLFTFGIVSWLIFALESMAASPLIALGVTHPEGHAILGKSEQALMMLVSVFLRPVMMVIGLTSGIVMSYVAISVLNYGFTDLMPIVIGKASAFDPWKAGGGVPVSSDGLHALQNIFDKIKGLPPDQVPPSLQSIYDWGKSQPGGTIDWAKGIGSGAINWTSDTAVNVWNKISSFASGDFKNFFESTIGSNVVSSMTYAFSGEVSPGTTVPKVLMLLIIYTFTVVSIINQCFSLIYKFPDEIMKYIGATGHQAGEAERMMGEIKGESKEMGGAMAGFGRGVEGGG